MSGCPGEYCEYTCSYYCKQERCLIGISAPRVQSENNGLNLTCRTIVQRKVSRTVIGR